MSELPDELAAASVRRYLRGHLPAVYSEAPGGQLPPVMGMLQELERILDPIVILLDNLTAHVEPTTAPIEMIDLLLEATGAPLDRTLPPAARQRLACEAARIARARGTRAGLQLALELAFPELAPEVLDGGRATWAAGAGAQAGAGAGAERDAFEVRLAREPTNLQRAQLDRCIADHRPLGASYELTVASR